MKDEPDSNGYANVISLIENVVETIKESTDQTPKQASRKRKPKSALSGTNERRNCLQCGKPKSKMEGEENLHYTFISQGSGMPSMFYCPTKMNNLFGTPLDMQFSEFKNSEFWSVHVDNLKKKKLEEAEKRKKAAEIRAAKGWKKSGPAAKNPKHD